MMQYIIVERLGLEIPFMFPTILNHDDFAEMVNASKVISAGFVTLNIDNQLRASGDSFSLGIKSRPEDSGLIEKFLKRS
jgi:hypothetical protein